MPCGTSEGQNSSSFGSALEVAEATVTSPNALGPAPTELLGPPKVPRSINGP